MIKKFSSPKIRNRQFVFTPKIEYQLVAERSEANPSNLQFPSWCGMSGSNRRLVLGKHVYYHYTNSALLPIYHFVRKISINNFVPRGRFELPRDCSQ
jgi:hypothetical protein